MAPPEFQDYYKTLGVARGATQAEIKKAFRKLARESHPDRHPGDSGAERRFKSINEANAVLSDAAKRSKYDQFGRDWEAYSRAGSAAGSAGGARGSGAGGDPFGPGSPFAGFRTSGGAAGAGGAGPGGTRFEFRTSGDAGSFSDFFHMMFGDESAAAGEPQAFSTSSGESIDDLLQRLGMSGAGGAGAARGVRGSPSGEARRPGGAASQPQRREPISVTAEISLEEAFHGTSRIVEIDGRRLEITIPRGAATGSRIRLTGKGPDGQDLVVVTNVKPHPVFARKGEDLEHEVPVTLREALLGSEVPIGTLKGKVLLKIPTGTQGGRVFRLKGQGMPRFKGGGACDLLVRVRVALPTNLSDAAAEAAERFLDLADQPDPRA